MNNAHLQWPFFEGHHRTLAAELEAWAAASVAHIYSDDNDADCKQLVSLLGEAGWLRHAVAGQWTRVLFVCCARPWRATTVWPTLLLPCKVWVQARFL